MVAKQCSTAIVAIFKDESPYILEWIAFHLTIGIDFFYIADNESSDGTTALLEALDKLKIIKHIRFRTPNDSPPQLPAYEKIMLENKDKHDWFAFIDADEFIMPQSGRSLDSFLADISTDNKIGAIGLNWAVYGSSNERKYRDGLVLERFQSRGEKTLTLNKHFKSLVRSKAYEKTAGNPHSFKLKEGFHYVHTDSRPITNLVPDVDGLSKDVCWGLFRLNHYVIKSYEEFTNKKNRGRATKVVNSQENRNESFFHEHDVNDVTEKVNADILASMKERLDALKVTLASNNSSDIITNTAFVLNDRLYGCYDSSKTQGQSIEVRGWAFSSAKNDLQYCVRLHDRELLIGSSHKIKRPDVQSIYQDAPVDCGFMVSCPIESTVSEKDLAFITVFVYINSRFVELKN